jgi:hypothetical protein
MEDQPHFSPSQMPVPTPPQHQATSGGHVYVGAGPNGTVKPMPSRRRLFAIAGAATVLVLATGGYVLGYYVPNKPSNVFRSALHNTADGYDQLVKYATTTQNAKTFANTQVDGSYKVDSSAFSTDGSFSDHTDQKNSAFSGDIGLGTTRLKLDGVIKGVDGSNYPDAYLKVSGIKGLGDEFGVPALDTLDGQWISIDHTFFSNVLKQAQDASGQSSASSTMSAPSEQDITDAAKVIGDQSRKYLFSTDPGTAVFAMHSFVGKETVDGKQTDHYKVTANKDHLKTYIDELGKALDKTKLNDWSKSNYNKSLSDMLDLPGMMKSADNIKSGDTFDMWVNTKTKLVHKIRISDSADPTNNYFEFGLNYNGGAEKPLFMNVHDKQDGVTTSANIGVNINTDTNVVKMNLGLTSDDGSGNGATNVTMNATAKPTTSQVDVTAPTGAISLSDALNRLGLGGYLDTLSQSLGQGLGSVQSNADQGSNPFTVSL